MESMARQHGHVSAPGAGIAIPDRQTGKASRPVAPLNSIRLVLPWARTPQTLVYVATLKFHESRLPPSSHHERYRGQVKRFGLTFTGAALGTAAGTALGDGNTPLGLAWGTGAFLFCSLTILWLLACYRAHCYLEGCEEVIQTLGKAGVPIQTTPAGGMVVVENESGQAIFRFPVSMN